MTDTAACESELRYEQLRREVLEGCCGLTHGLAILLRGGMTSWLQALASRREATPSAFRGTEQSRVPLPSDSKGEIVRILAGMALGLGCSEGT